MVKRCFVFDESSLRAHPSRRSRFGIISPDAVRSIDKAIRKSAARDAYPQLRIVYVSTVYAERTKKRIYLPHACCEKNLSCASCAVWGCVISVVCSRPIVRCASESARNNFQMETARFLPWIVTRRRRRVFWRVSCACLAPLPECEIASACAG